MRVLLSICFFQLLLLSTISNAAAQGKAKTYDSTYIQPFKNFVSIGPRIGLLKDTYYFKSRNIGFYRWESDVNPGVGLFLKYKKLPGVKIAFPIPFSEMEGEVKTKGINIAMALQPVRFLTMDITFSYLTGYNLTGLREDTTVERKLKSLNTINLVFESFYLFNSEKFSYNAIYNFGEQQLKTAGSFLIGLNYNYLRQNNYGSFKAELNHSITENFDRTSVNAFAILGGYILNGIVGKRKYGIISAGLFLGPQFHFGNLIVADHIERIHDINLHGKFKFGVGMTKNNWLFLINAFVNYFGYDFDEFNMVNALYVGEIRAVYRFEKK